MRSISKLMFWMFISLGLLACSTDESNSSILATTVERATFVFSVPAKGELISAEAISINAPSGNRGQLTLAWMAEENSRVKAGDVIARFDGTEHALEKQRASLNLEKTLLSQDITSRDLFLNKFSSIRRTASSNRERKMLGGLAWKIWPSIRKMKLSISC